VAGTWQPPTAAATWRLLCQLAGLRAYALESHPRDHALLRSVDEALDTLGALQHVQRHHHAVLEEVEDP